MRGVGGAMAESDQDRLLAVSEVAKRFSVSDQTIYRWIDEGILPVVKVRRLLRIRQSDVHRLLEESSAPAAPLAGGWTGEAPEGRRVRGTMSFATARLSSRTPPRSRGLTRCGGTSWRHRIRGSPSGCGRLRRRRVGVRR